MGAARYERTASRCGYRNGSYDRTQQAPIVPPEAFDSARAVRFSNAVAGIVNASEQPIAAQKSGCGSSRSRATSAASCTRPTPSRGSATALSRLLRCRSRRKSRAYARAESDPETRRAHWELKEP